MSQPKTTFDELLSPLDEIVAQIENQRKVHHREVLSFSLFVRLLFYSFIMHSQSGRQLLTTLITLPEKLGLGIVKRSTFFDAFNRFPVSWFATLFTVVLTTVTWQVIPEIEILGKLYLVDGSIFPALSTMLWAEYKTNRPAIKLHLSFELNRMIPVTFLVKSGNSSETSALRQMLEAEVTYIADRGYASFDLLKDILEAQAHFLIRMKHNLVSQRIERLPVTLPNSVKHIFTKVSDSMVKLTNATGHPAYRLVTFRVGKEKYLVLTDRLDLTTFQVLLLYAYRWQIELFFRFIKRTMKGLHLFSTSQQGIRIQFYVLLTAALLQLRLKQQCIAEFLPCENTLEEQESEEECIPGLMIPPSKLISSRGQTFLATVGEKLHHFWKISIHWLLSLQNLFAKPFDKEVRRLLAFM